GSITRYRQKLVQCFHRDAEAVMELMGGSDGRFEGVFGLRQRLFQMALRKQVADLSRLRNELRFGIESAKSERDAKVREAAQWKDPVSYSRGCANAFSQQFMEKLNRLWNGSCEVHASVLGQTLGEEESETSSAVWPALTANASASA